MPAPIPSESAFSPELSASPVKLVHSENAPASVTRMATNGDSSSRTQIGVVQACILDRAVMPKITSGMTTRATIRYPSHSGRPRPISKACAMIDPSSAKKMMVKVA
jgi:hypothetical protein